jgi:tetratricopeptide (TPR) repeat protein
MRKIIIVLSCCLGLLLVGYTSYRGYQIWKQNHGLAMAQGYFAKGDMRSSLLSLQQVLRINPRNIEACRMMAGVMEAAHISEALLWRQRVLQLNPKSFEDHLALAQAAIVFQNYPLATNALAGVADADKNNAAYHNIAGTAALEGGKPDEAEAHFSECIRLDPSNPIPQVNLAVVRLHRTNDLDIAEARIALQRVITDSTNSTLRSQARRELIEDAMRFNDFPTALTQSKELAQPTNSVFPDKLLRLYVLLKTQSAEFKPTLASYQHEAATDPDKIPDLTKWQVANLSTTEALGWLQNLPMQNRTNRITEMLAAECQLQLKKWGDLQTSIQHQNWSDPLYPWKDCEFMRHAFIARALREQNLPGASTAEWVVALKAASGQKVDLISLLEKVAAWDWNTEGEQILWIVVNRYPEEKWAAPLLAQTLSNRRRTRSLMELLSIMAKRNPDDLGVKNNLAMTAMLLGAQELKPYDLALQVYQKAATNAADASTYAFSLYLQKKYTEALRVMQELAPKDLNDPAIAGYYGLILKANGNKKEAKAYLNIPSQSQLLTEEQALFEQAKTGL